MYSRRKHDLYLLYTREIIELGTHCNPTPRPWNIDELWLNDPITDFLKFKILIFFESLVFRVLLILFLTTWVFLNMVGLIVPKKYGINFTNTKDPQKVI